MPFDLVAAGPLPPREYVLLVSGTMNPPHIGHVRLGLAAADKMRKSGHVVRAICFLPVHDNYLCNKVALKRRRGAELSVLDSIAFPMSERCALLKRLIAGELAGSAGAMCHVLDYEHSSDDRQLLATSPGYWSPKLPEGYLKTVPTASLIGSFGANSPLMSDGARLGVVFGVDNLAGMASWNDPASLLVQADLVVLARGMPSVTFRDDPTALLSALKYVEVRAPVPVVHQCSTLLGGTQGSFENPVASGSCALFLLPALDAGDESLSSTRVREAIAARVAATDRGTAASLAGAGSSNPEAVLAAHGYSDTSCEQLLSVARQGDATVERMVASGTARGEWVEPGAKQGVKRGRTEDDVV